MRVLTPLSREQNGTSTEATLPSYRNNARKENPHSVRNSTILPCVEEESGSTDPYKYKEPRRQWTSNQ